MFKSPRRLLQVIVSLVLTGVIAFVGVQLNNPQSSPVSSNMPRMMGPAGGAPVSGDDKDAAQDAAPFEVVQAAKQDVSKPLREMKPLPARPHSQIREMPEPEMADKGAVESEAKDPVVQSSAGATGDSLAEAMPGPIVNVNGLGNRDGVYPPDTNGDVGPNHYFQAVNLSFQIFNKSGASVYGPAAGNTIWSGFGGTCEATNDGDPIVLYDSIADRWLMSQFTAGSPYGECMAISKTGDPTGAYYRYFFQFSTSVFYDYPHLGVWPDGYYMAANRFQCRGMRCSFQGPSAIVFERDKMLNGQPARYVAFNPSNSYASLLPSDLDGATLPPAGSPNYFMALGGTSSLYFWKFKVNWTSTSSSTFTGPTTLAAATYSQLCATTRNCVPQPGTSVKLDAVADRLMHRLAYRNFGTHESLVVNHTVNAGSSRAGVRWYEVRNPGGAPSVYQQGTYAPNDGLNRWMASAAMDNDGNIAIGYSVSSSTVHPGIRYTGRLAGDPLGTLPQGEATLVNGSGSQTGTGYRWGDYSMMTVDPVDDCTFWYTTEYMPTTGTASWQTRIGSFKFSSCTP